MMEGRRVKPVTQRVGLVALFCSWISDWLACVVDRERERSLGTLCDLWNQWEAISFHCCLISHVLTSVRHGTNRACCWWGAARVCQALSKCRDTQQQSSF